MTFKDLKTGDILIQRAGHIGVFIEKDHEGVLIYQHGGYDAEDCFNEDLTDSTDDPNGDIMQVYRAEDGAIAISFTDYAEGTLIFERDSSWKRPTTDYNK